MNWALAGKCAVVFVVVAVVMYDMGRWLVDRRAAR